MLLISLKSLHSNVTSLRLGCCFNKFLIAPLDHLPVVSSLLSLAYPPKYLAPKLAQNPTSPTYQSSYFSLFDLTFLYSSSYITSGIFLDCILYNLTKL